MRLLRDAHCKKIKTAEALVDANLGMNLSEFVEICYSENRLKNVFLRIIENDFDRETADLFQKKLGELYRHRDVRSPAEYACDLLVGWITEDMALLSLKDLGYECEIVSKDRNREFLLKPSSEIDIMVTLKNGRKILVEHISDHTGFWQKTKKLHLRAHKYERLLEDSGVLLGFDYANGSFFVEKVFHIPLLRRVQSHFPYGGKPASELDLNGIAFYKFENMKSVINRFFGGFEG